MRTVLLIAYHFPPVVGSSGLQRTLRFAQYLPRFDWRPIVLTVRPRAYEKIDPRSLAQVPADCKVVRTACIDVGTRLPKMHRLMAFTALPDRWASWQLSAVRAARSLVKEHGVRAVWSTYPIATAHRIGSIVSKQAGLPWVADFRDPMAQEGYPADPRRWQAFKRIEEAAAQQAAKLVFVSPSALRMYRERYPGTPASRFELIENGFDEESFEGLDADARAPGTGTPVLLHSGIVYPSERDPRALFEALGRLAAGGRIRPGDFVVRFRAAVHEKLLRELAARHGVQPFIDIQPAVPYREALREMLGAEALLVMQGSNCNGQIPAKVYEYLRAGRPILGLADPAGDTGRLLSRLGASHVVALESARAIELALPQFLESLRTNAASPVSRVPIGTYSRRTLTGRLAALLDEVAG